jgi:hypothetical protein
MRLALSHMGGSRTKSSEGAVVPFFKIKAEFICRSETAEGARKRALALLNEPGRRTSLTIEVEQAAAECLQRPAASDRGQRDG